MEQIQKIGILTTQELKESISNIISHFPKQPNTQFIFLTGDERLVPHPQIQILILHKGLTKPILSEVLKAHSNLKWIYSYFTGVEQILVPELVESSIQLTNAKNCYSQSLGEFVSFAILYYSKKIPLFLKQKEYKIWKQAPVDVIKGKTLCIVGYGDIGTEVAKRAKRGFEMKVIGVKKNPESITQEAKSYTDQILGNQNCQTAIKAADFVVSILPGLQSTYHYFDLDKFKIMKPSAIFISIGRGTVVNENDLIEALQQQIIGGAVLDVFEKEPLSQDSKLWDLENVLILPHSADYTVNQGDLSFEMFLTNLRAYNKGEPLVSVVDKKKGY